MIEVTEKEFELNFDSYMDRIEGGEEFLIRLSDGRAVAAVPADKLDPLGLDTNDESWYNTFSNHNDAS